MACATIHLAFAKKYLEQHPFLNYREVIAGTLYLMQQIIMMNHTIQMQIEATII